MLKAYNVFIPHLLPYCSYSSTTVQPWIIHQYAQAETYNDFFCLTLSFSPETMYWCSFAFANAYLKFFSRVDLSIGTILKLDLHLFFLFSYLPACLKPVFTFELNKYFKEKNIFLTLA